MKQEADYITTLFFFVLCRCSANLTFNMQTENMFFTSLPSVDMDHTPNHPVVSAFSKLPKLVAFEGS